MKKKLRGRDPKLLKEISIEIKKIGGFPKKRTNLPRGLIAKWAEKYGARPQAVKDAIKFLRIEAGVNCKNNFTKKEPAPMDIIAHAWAVLWGCLRKSPNAEIKGMKIMRQVARVLPRGGISLLIGTWTHAAYSLCKTFSGRVFRDNFDTAKVIFETSAETLGLIGNLVKRAKAFAKKRAWYEVFPAILFQVGPVDPVHFERYIRKHAKRGGLVKVYFAMSGEWKGYKAIAMRLSLQFPKLYIVTMVRHTLNCFKIVVVNQGTKQEYTDLDEKNEENEYLNGLKRREKK